MDFIFSLMTFHWGRKPVQLGRDCDPGFHTFPADINEGWLADFGLNLQHRAAELKPGGRMFAAFLGPLDEASDLVGGNRFMAAIWMRNVEATFVRLAAMDPSLLSADEALFVSRLCPQLVLNARQQCEAAARHAPDLEVVQTFALAAPCPYHARFLDDGDAEAWRSGALEAYLAVGQTAYTGMYGKLYPDRAARTQEFSDALRAAMTAVFADMSPQPAFPGTMNVLEVQRKQ